MAIPLVPSLVFTALALAGHVRPRFSHDPELLDAGPSLFWARSGALAGPVCRCRRGVRPRGGLRLQAVTAGNGACCTLEGDVPCRPETTAVATRSPVAALLPRPAAAAPAAAAKRVASRARGVAAPGRSNPSAGSGAGGCDPASRASVLVHAAGASGLTTGAVHAPALGT